MTEIERHIDTLEKLIPEIEMGMNLFSYDRSALQAALQALRRTAEDDKAREDGRSEKLALAMGAGARAIMQNKRYHGATYVYDVFGAGKKISYYEAANLLRQEAEAALGGEK